MGVVCGRLLGRGSSRIRASELDLSRVPGWDARGPVGVLQLSPEIEVDRGPALVDLEIQPSVASPLTETEIDFRRSLDPSYTAPPTQLVRIERGYVETSMCVALTPDFKFVRDSVRKVRTAEKKGYEIHGAELTLPDRPVAVVDFPAALVGLPYSHNYFHWMFEAVGRFLAAREFLPIDVRLLVHPGARPFELDALVAAGVSRESIFELPADHLVAFPVLYVPPSGVSFPRADSALPDGRPQHLVPFVVDALRALSRPGLGRRRRLYVSRAEAKFRRVVNDDEVLATLAGHGFSSVPAASLSVDDQIELFSQANAVIAVHGAGLTNAVFGAPGSTLIELQPTGIDSVLFRNLATICGFDYLEVVCHTVMKDGSVDALHADVWVDCAHLDTVLARRLPPL